MGIKNDSTIPRTSTPIVNPINTPLPDSGEISWDSDKSNSKSKVIIKQPNASISPVSADKTADKSPSYVNIALAKDVVLDAQALLSKVNDNTNIITEADSVIAAPLGQPLPAIEPLV